MILFIFIIFLYRNKERLERYYLHFIEHFSNAGSPTVKSDIMVEFIQKCSNHSCVGCIQTQEMLTKSFHKPPKPNVKAKRMKPCVALSLRAALKLFTACLIELHLRSTFSSLCSAAGPRWYTNLNVCPVPWEGKKDLKKMLAEHFLEIRCYNFGLMKKKIPCKHNC